MFGWTGLFVSIFWTHYNKHPFATVKLHPLDIYFYYMKRMNIPNRKSEVVNFIEEGHTILTKEKEQKDK